MDKNDPHKLTAAEAIALLSPHDEDGRQRVHTFTASPMMMGCDVDLDDIIKRLDTSEDIRLSGPRMYAMGHGVEFQDPKYNQIMFLEADKEKVSDMVTSRKIGNSLKNLDSLDTDDLVNNKLKEYTEQLDDPALAGFINALVEAIPDNTRRKVLTDNMPRVKSKNACSNCGFDMGDGYENCGASEDGVCPECGKS